MNNLRDFLSKRSSSLQRGGCKIILTPYGEGYICPAFNPSTSRCMIYDQRPVDCMLYPFAIMWDLIGKEIVLGVDTKCPYISRHMKDPHIRGALPEIVSAIESEPLISIFDTDRELIGPYQDDVIPLATLKRLTHRLCDAALL